MGPTGCPETSVTKFQSTLCNIPEEWKPHLYRGGSLQPHATVARVTKSENAEIVVLSYCFIETSGAPPGASNGLINDSLAKTMPSSHRTSVKNDLVRKLQNLYRYFTSKAQKIR